MIGNFRKLTPSLGGTKHLSRNAFLQTCSLSFAIFSKHFCSQVFLHLPWNVTRIFEPPHSNYLKVNSCESTCVKIKTENQLKSENLQSAVNGPHSGGCSWHQSAIGSELLLRVWQNCEINSTVSLECHAVLFSVERIAEVGDGCRLMWEWRLTDDVTPDIDVTGHWRHRILTSLNADVIEHWHHRALTSPDTEVTGHWRHWTLRSPDTDVTNTDVTIAGRSETDWRCPSDRRNGRRRWPLPSGICLVSTVGHWACAGRSRTDSDWLISRQG